MRFIILLLTFIITVPTLAHALDVSPDGPLIINLREDAKSVIVGNPNHATVTMDNPRLLIVNAGLPGVTSLTVLGEDGRVILSDKVISGGAAQGYVRIQNACINAEAACQPVKMFYCEEGSSCHNVVVAETAPAASTSQTGIEDNGFVEGLPAEPAPLEEF